MNAFDKLMSYDPSKIVPQKKTVKRKLQRLNNLELEFELVEISTEEMSKLQAETMGLNVNGEVRMNLYDPSIKKILYGCPLFSNKELVARFGCQTPKDLISKILNKGDMDFLTAEIDKLSGFDPTKELQDKEEIENL